MVTEHTLPSPREFLRARRPERFSDSVSEDKPTLDRAVLEYHLQSLTNLSQEADFQDFARKLAEKEICPNLLPQTGPTGGGDSKVDAETYPVADKTSFIWYVGVGRDAAVERWAFAISAKKDWRTKVKGDIKKIAETKRGYSKAFFITNQYVPDRKRAEIEDELRQLYKLDVRLLDLTWILDKVFAGSHELLAIEHLKLGVSLRKEIRKGPRDTEREQDLREVEARIKQAVDDGHLGVQFVHDCIEAATLARSLERPRTVTDGLFIRAERAAVKYGNDHQQLLAAYEYAWTSYWWHEDYSLVGQLYGIVESRANGTCNSYELELLSNLWHLLFMIANANHLDAATLKLDQRSETLAAELERLSNEDDRPSTSLHAKSLRLIMRLIHAAPDGVDEVFDSIKGLILQSEGLVGFPLQPLVEILTEVGPLFVANSKYEELVQTIVEVTSTRKGDIEAARLLVRHGAQQLDGDRPVDAIRSFGRALAKLFTHESRHDMVHALSLCGAAYERVGLLWAARGSILTAASIATSEFWTYADVTPQQAACYRRMKWLELQLGRVPQVLEWHSIDLAVRQVLADQGYDIDRLRVGKFDFDAILGILLLRTETWQLRWLTRLPDVLDNLLLHNASVALRYALGHEDKQFNEIAVRGTSENDVLFTFLRWRDQPAGKELPGEPLYCDGQTVRFGSTLLGCHIEAIADNDATCIALTESVLAALESLLATGTIDRFAAREPTLTVSVKKSGIGDSPFVFTLQDRDGRPNVDILCRDFNPNSMPTELQKQVRSTLLDLLACVLARVFIFANLEQDLIRLFGDDRAMERAVSFTSSFVTLGNVLGHSPRNDISRWCGPEMHDYPLTRAKAWDADVSPRGENSDSKAQATPGDDIKKDIAEAIESGRIKHTQMEMVSLIRETLWNEAEWVGNAFSWTEGNNEPPVLAPVFNNAEAAAKIFSLWRSEIGESDKSNKLRVSIIRGISRTQPYSYRVVFGANPWQNSEATDIRFVVTMSRIQTMTPTSDSNLKLFLSNYSAKGVYYIAHAVHPDSNGQPELIFENAILKNNLNIRDAWEIGRNDLDSVAILPDDDPIIPAAKSSNAPVLEALQWKKEHPNERV
jgi:hypothetical protein